MHRGMLVDVVLGEAVAVGHLFASVNDADRVGGDAVLAQRDVPLQDQDRVWRLQPNLRKSGGAVPHLHEDLHARTGVLAPAATAAAPRAPRLRLHALGLLRREEFLAVPHRRLVAALSCCSDSGPPGPVEPRQRRRLIAALSRIADLGGDGVVERGLGACATRRRRSTCAARLACCGLAPPRRHLSEVFAEGHDALCASALLCELQRRLAVHVAQRHVRARPQQAEHDGGAPEESGPNQRGAAGVAAAPLVDLRAVPQRQLDQLLAAIRGGNHQRGGAVASL
mmetsp:Transcript_45470/g.146495  ORF Transcript_45470/g.146495 Transcript_45470/m.146495 type:complete len:282 (+) Transcript_45470:346-1191(+)